MSKQKIFSREFKLEAIRSLDSGKKQATELARELGIPCSRLYAWRQQLQVGDKSDAFPGHGRRVGKDAELAALKAENERLREDNELLKKSGPLLREGVTMRYRFIRDHQRQHCVSAMCRVLEVCAGASMPGVIGAVVAELKTLNSQR